MELASLVEMRVFWALHHCALPAGDSWRRPSPAYAVWLMLDGAAKVTIQGQSWQVEQGAVFVADCRERREITIPQRAEWLTVGLAAELRGRDVLQSLPRPAHWIPADDERAALRFCLSEIVRLHSAPGTAQLVAQGLTCALTGLLLQAHRVHNFENMPGGAPIWADDVLRYIRENPGADVADLARVAHFSPAQFRRVFREWAGTSPHDFLQNERLKLARRLLENTTVPIEAIARQTGFSGAAAFTRAFRYCTGHTPSAYRASARLAAENQA
jgi:AraC-like DNA-binding protein